MYSLRRAFGLLCLIFLVHVSPGGKDFVAITQIGIAYFVPNFERVMRGETSFSETALRIKFDGAATNLSYEYDRVIITTVRFFPHQFLLYKLTLFPDAFSLHFFSTYDTSRSLPGRRIFYTTIAKSIPEASCT